MPVKEKTASYLLSFIVSVFNALQAPLLSVYAYDLGIGKVDIGLINGVAPFFYALTAPFSAILSGRLGVRRTIAASLSILSLSYFVFSVSKSPLALILVNVACVSSFALFWPAVEVLVSHSGGSVRAFTASWSSGAIVGAFLTAPLLEVEKAWVFKGLGVLSLVLLGLSFLVSDSEDESELRSFTYFSEALRRLYVSWLSCFVYAFAQTAVFVFYPVLAEEIYLPPLQVGAVLSALTSTRTVTFILYPRLRRIWQHELMGALLLALGLGFLAGIPQMIPSILSATIMGIGAGLLYASALTAVFEQKNTSMYTGLFESFIGLGYGVSPLLGGYVATFSTQIAMVVTAVLSFTIILTVMLLRELRITSFTRKGVLQGSN